MRHGSTKDPVLNAEEERRHRSSCRWVASWDAEVPWERSVQPWKTLKEKRKLWWQAAGTSSASVAQAALAASYQRCFMYNIATEGAVPRSVSFEFSDVSCLATRVPVRCPCSSAWGTGQCSPGCRVELAGCVCQLHHLTPRGKKSSSYPVRCRDYCWSLDCLFTFTVPFFHRSINL